MNDQCLICYKVTNDLYLRIPFGNSQFIHLFCAQCAFVGTALEPDTSVRKDQFATYVPVNSLEWKCLRLLHKQNDLVTDLVVSMHNRLIIQKICMGLDIAETY